MLIDLLSGPVVSDCQFIYTEYKFHTFLSTLCIRTTNTDALSDWQPAPFASCASPCCNDGTIKVNKLPSLLLVTASSYATMDSSSALSDDDYDVISNPGRGSLDSFDFTHELYSAVRELPASEEAKDRFETTRWTASDIQAYIQKGLVLRGPAPKKLVHIYVDGSFDMFDVGHALQLRQAKLSFSFVHLIVGVFSDEVLLQNGYTFNWPELERLELVRHCRWVNEVTKDAPWELTLQFIQDKGIDFVAVDEGSSVDPNYDRARVRGYDELKRHGIIIKTRRTQSLNSQRRLVSLAPSRRETPTTPGTPTLETLDCAMTRKG